MKKPKLTEEEKLLRLRVSDLKKNLQTLVNKFVRYRDTNNGTKGNCISCGRELTYGNSNVHSSHYIDCGANGKLRFDLFNLNAGCANCNVFQNGNKLGYREGLIKKYGEAKEKELFESRKDTLLKVDKIWYVNEILRYKQILKELGI